LSPTLTEVNWSRGTFYKKEEAEVQNKNEEKAVTHKGRLKRGK